MSTFINNGLTGLLAAQRALQTTANNVANVNTDGYVRQRAIINEAASHNGSQLSIGQGVQVVGIERIYDQFIADELQTATMSQHRAMAYNDLALRLDSILGNPELSASAALQRFFDQAEAVNRDPTSVVNRQQFIAEGQTLLDRFGQLDAQLGQIENSVDGRLSQAVGTVNGLARSLADVNERITLSAGNIPNDLLDEQDRLLKQLAEQIDFSTTTSEQGSVNILIGNGQPLVLGTRANELALAQHEFDASRMELAFSDGSTTQPISSKITGGELAGLLSFRDAVMADARRDLGLMMLGLAEAFNDQHRLGIDLNGELGGEFFQVPDPMVSGSVSNTGSATVTATVASPAALEARDYIMRFDGSNWQLSDASTGASVSMTGTGTAGDPFLAEGLEIVVAAGAAAGDKFKVMPVRLTPGGTKLAISDPAKIAAASPVTASVSLNNQSDSKISTATVNDITDPQLLDTAEIRFESAGTYRIYDDGGADLTGPQAYTSGADISFNGWTVQISGTPADGDSFFVGSTGPNSGDNGNALALTDLGTQRLFANGTLSLSDMGANLLAGIGLIAGRAAQDLDVQSALRDQVELDFEAVSGVNLEEEAANMLRYQEAYQAAARIVSVANDLFNSLLNSLR